MSCNYFGISSEVGRLLRIEFVSVATIGAGHTIGMRVADETLCLVNRRKYKTECRGGGYLFGSDPVVAS